MSMISGLLVRSAQFVKCASGTSFIPRMFGHSLYEVEPKLGACMEIAEWGGGTAEFENALFAEADRALYMAKKRGRDQFVVESSMRPEEPQPQPQPSAQSLQSLQSLPAMQSAGAAPAEPDCATPA